MSNGAPLTQSVAIGTPGTDYALKVNADGSINVNTGSGTTAYRAAAVAAYIQKEQFLRPAGLAPAAGLTLRV